MWACFLLEDLPLGSPGETAVAIGISLRYPAAVGASPSGFGHLEAKERIFRELEPFREAHLHIFVHESSGLDNTVNREQNGFWFYAKSLSSR